MEASAFSRNARLARALAVVSPAVGPTLTPSPYDRTVEADQSQLREHRLEPGFPSPFHGRERRERRNKRLSFHRSNYFRTIGSSTKPSTFVSSVAFCKSCFSLDESAAVHGAQLFSFISRLARCFRTGTSCGRPRPATQTDSRLPDLVLRVTIQALLLSRLVDGPIPWPRHLLSFMR